MNCEVVVNIVVVLSLVTTSGSTEKQPNIVYLMADDLGWNDVGFHNRHVYTPHLDKMAEDGLEMTQSYVLPLCSPSRQALLTGRYPFRDGAQHLVYHERYPKCLPLDLTLLPEKLRDLGYSTHLIGKWHLGFCNLDCTPTKRGFDSFYGFYGGYIEHFTCTRDGFADFRDNETTVNNKQRKYATNLFTERAEELIRHHNTEEPIFLFVSYDLTHSPLQAPEYNIQRYSHIKEDSRRTYLAMVTTIDQSAANITRALRDKGMLQNTLIIFQADNGASVLLGGNNYPLRGGKLTLWEGGTRSVTLVGGGYLKGRKGQVTSLFHISDWYPTLIHAAGGSVEPSTNGGIDGINQLDVILNGSPGQREEFVYNLDIHVDRFLPVAGYAAYRYKNYKLLLGYTGFGDANWPSPWLRPPEMCQNETSDGNPECQFRDTLMGERDEERAAWKNRSTRKREPEAYSTGTQLYDLDADPYERSDISGAYPEITEFLTERTRLYMEQAAIPVMPPAIDDLELTTKDGFYSSGWCSRDQLIEQRLYSLGSVRRTGDIPTSCDKDSCPLP